MNSFRRKLFCLAGAAACCTLSLFAQPAATTAPAAPKSPVALFRELLKMSPAERQGAIAIRPPDIQKRILVKLEEYEILPGELRELRLQETELRWYLRPLMDEPKTNRAARLAQIPEDERALVEERLELWDLLPPSLQEEMRNNDLVANYLAQTASATAAEREADRDLIPPERRAELEKGIDRWKTMSQEQQQKALAGFNHFFALTPEDQKQALDTVPDTDRQQMEQTLAAYGKLTPGQRAQCIKSFEKFATMSVAERQQFLKNAESWSKMTPEERQKWRELVNVAPILPPSANPPGHTLPSGSLEIDAPAVANN